MFLTQIFYYRVNKIVDQLCSWKLGETFPETNISVENQSHHGNRPQIQSHEESSSALGDGCLVDGLVLLE